MQIFVKDLMRSSKPFQSLDRTWEKEWWGWVFSFKKPFLVLKKQPRTKETKLMERGVGTECSVFTAPSLPDDLWVFQAHISWADELKSHLQNQGDMEEIDVGVVSGSDTKCTKYMCVSLPLEPAMEAMNRFGAYPRFTVIPPLWHEGISVDNKTDILEVYINKLQRTDTAPFTAPSMFDHLLNVFFDDGEVFSNGSVAIQVMSYNKIRLGLTKQSLQLLKPMHAGEGLLLFTALHRAQPL